MIKLNHLVPQSIKNLFYHLPRSLIALLLYNFPAKNLTVIGITGSDGKTTTTHMIYHILHKAGFKVAMISTVAARIGAEEIDTGFHVTSPDPFLLQKLFRRIADQGFTHVVLEATSHGLDQHRLLGANVKVAAVTNITHEHLDYHQNYVNYVQAKSRLFSNASWAILNKDDKSYPLLKAYIPKSAKIISYSLTSKSSLKATGIISDDYSTAFTVHWSKDKTKVFLPLPGKYNIENSLASLAVVGVLGVKLQTAAAHLQDFPPVIGRLNKVHQKPDIYIDFAHTPNALEQVLKFLKSQKRPNSRLISVFGVAGERDFLKRPMMGKIACRFADIAIFTTEDSRSEDVNKIINQMVEGAGKTKAREINNTKLTDNQSPPIFTRVPDRQSAIDLAIKIAKPLDTIVITGKGHEKSMNLGSGEIPWSDFDAVSKALRKQ